MRATKPSKPYRDFPLTAHPNGTWCKKVKGVLRHFGGWADPDAALAKYNHQIHDLQAGHEPSPIPTGEQLTVIRLCEEFLESKEKARDIGRLTRITWRDYYEICELVMQSIGQSKLVEQITPKDFDNMLVDFTKGKRKATVGLVTQRNRVRSARTLFKFAHEQGFIAEPLKFGQNFKIPDKSTLRAERHVKGRRDFTAVELRSIIDAAETPLKAMVLLGVNAGLGNTDCSSLPLTALDLKAGWLDFPRPKTGVLRRAPLWPETVAALRDAIKNGYEPLDPDDAGLVFINELGKQFVRVSLRGSWMDMIADRFHRLLDSLEIDRTNRGFYSLRRTLETIASGCLDQIALDRIMGHAAPAHDAMPETYRQWLADARLKKVSNYVRSWLFKKTKTTKKAGKRVKAR